MSYDYQRKGDRFSRGLSQRPRVWTKANNYNTGRSSIQRTSTSRAQGLTITQIKALLTKDQAATLETLTLYLYDTPDGLRLGTKPDTGGLPLRFEATAQALGRRHWFCCTGCGQRVGKLYTVKTQEGRVWGCQKCLGLSYPSQSQHKTQARDTAITQGRIKVSWREEIGAYQRQTQRIMKLGASFDRQFGKRK